MRRVLLWLAMVCLLPGILGAAALMVYQHQQSRQQLEQQTQLTARALQQAIEHQLLKIMAVAQTLSLSAHLRQGDFKAFHAQARQALRLVGLPSNVVLRDREGRQLLNTAVDFNGPLSVPAAPLQVEAVFTTAAPTISDLFIGPVLKRAVMSVDVPVMQGNQVAYALGISVLPEQMSQILRTQSLPPKWFAGVLDQNGFYVGRNREPERFVGQRGTPSLLRQLDLSKEGVGDTVTPEGVEVVTFHNRSDQTGWAVAIGIPREIFTQELYTTSAYLAAGMVVLFAAGCMLAWLLGGRIASAFASLSSLAAGLGEGQRVRQPELHIREAGQVAAAMDRAAVLLEERASTLKESEERFKALADNMVQLAWMADQHGQIMWFNRRWYEYTGGRDDELMDGHWQRCLHPDHAANAQQKFEQHMHSGEPWEDTFPLRGRHGEYRWFLSNALPLRDRAGRITHWFGTHTDITPQRDAQQALHEAHVRKDEFIAILAHELRNPLAPVRTAVEIMQRAAPQDPQLARACRVIERQVTHMARLIDDLLDVARIANGKLALHLKTCDVAAIARHTAEDYQLSMESAGLDFEIHTPALPVWVKGDAVRLAQMMGNLLNNATRFTERGGRVEVWVGAHPDLQQAVVQVLDNGVGISAELMQRLFDPFSQAAQDLARSKGGLGLGLALTKGLVELHGGSLSVESAGLGQGALFTLRLALAATAPPAWPSSPAAHPHRALRVLVIEDNQDAARTLGELLELLGHKVQLAFDGDSGVAAARRFAPEVVVSDIGLPGATDGYAVARHLRASEPLKSVFLIALSGYTDEQARDRAREAGFDLYLFKPVNLQELEQALEQALHALPR